MRVRVCDDVGRTVRMRNAQYGLWTATERRGGGGQAAAVAVSTAAAAAQLVPTRRGVRPPTEARVDVAHAGQWLNRDRPRPVHRPRRGDVCGVVFIIIGTLYIRIYTENACVCGFFFPFLFLFPHFLPIFIIIILLLYFFFSYFSLSLSF